MDTVTCTLCNVTTLKGFKWDLHTRSEAHQLAALTARVKELEEANDRLEKTAFQAVAHVAAANYPEREREAYNMLYAALKGKS